MNDQVMLDSIERLPKQVEQAWNETQELYIPNRLLDVNSVAIFGMGGSSLGGRIIHSVFGDQLTFPFTVTTESSVAPHINETTLAILVSYSGNTEEVLRVAEEIEDYTTKIIVITTGGKLAQVAEHKQWVRHVIKPIHNPSQQPRAGLGYLLTSQLGLLSKTHLLEIKQDMVRLAAQHVEAMQAALSDSAHHAAAQINEGIIAFVGAEFLSGNVIAVTNQTIENSKMLSVALLIPEMNHNYLEVLCSNFEHSTRPYVLFLHSQLYSRRNQQRLEVLSGLLTKDNVPFSSFTPLSSTKLSQSLEVLVWGSYFSYHLALKNSVHPVSIPCIDKFKAQLAAIPR